jgi:drug/metabolite transporter (DMT)-like permease
MKSRLALSDWAVFMPLIFVFLWSTGFIVARYAMPLAPPFKFLEMRYLFSLACFAAWVLWAKVAYPREPMQWVHIGVTGLLMQSGYLGGVWFGIKSGMGSGLTALIVGLQPILTAVWLSIRRHQISVREWMGLTLGLLGVIFVIYYKLEASLEVSVLGLSAELVALLSITAGTLYQKALVKSCDVRAAGAIQLLASALVTLPFAFFEVESIQWEPQFFYALAWSVIGLTLGAGSLLYLLIQKGAASGVSSLMYLVPPCTALLAWVLFDEGITLFTFVGLGLTAVGVWLVVRATPSLQQKG